MWSFLVQPGEIWTPEWVAFGVNRGDGHCALLMGHDMVTDAKSLLLRLLARTVSQAKVHRSR